MPSRNDRRAALDQQKTLLLLHEDSLATFGGASGIRDDGLLDSALAGRRNAHAYNPESAMVDLADSYAFGLGKNHAFVDGNKRAACLSIGIFLAINGLKLVADRLNAFQTILAVAATEMNERGLSAWIHNNILPR